MRLDSIHLKNFRKLKDCKIKFRDTSFLIGPNNSGKSSVFNAIEALHGDKNLSREDYLKTYDIDRDEYIYEEEVEIVAEYRNLPDEAHHWTGFRGRILNISDPLEGETSNGIIYKKIWNLNSTKAKVFMLEYSRSVSEKYTDATVVFDLIGDDFSEEFLAEYFGSSNMSKKLSVAAVDKKLVDLDQYWNFDTESEAVWVENPGGIPGNVLSKLPQIILIPAESCIEELTSTNGALHKLLGELFNRVRDKSDNYEKAQEFLTKLAEELDPTDEDTDFGKLINDLNTMTHTLFPDSSVHVAADLNQPDKVIKPQFSVEMESNVKTQVKYQGHGMIRATVFQLLRYIQEFINRESEGTSRTSIFCFEEPEIYLHPAAANQMRDALYDLSGSNSQIIATTHSPYMINLSVEKGLSLSKFSVGEDGFSNCFSFNLSEGFRELVGDEKSNLKMLLKVDDYIARMFFTSKSVFVEGDTEEVVIRETLLRLPKDVHSRVVGNCEFFRARGKAVMISLAKYLNAIGIEYLIVHDRDSGTPKAESFNEPILAQTGDSRRIMIEDCIEDILGYTPPSSEKPYKAYKFISDNWPNTFDEMTGDWKTIFMKICSPYINEHE